MLFFEFTALSNENMIIKYTLTICLLFFVLGLHAQSGVAINESGNSFDLTAIFDVQSSSKGILIPRIPLTGISDVTTIPNPTTSLLVYNTATTSDVVEGFYFYSGSAWTPIAGAGITDDQTFSEVLAQGNAAATGQFVVVDKIQSVGTDGLSLVNSSMDGIVIGQTGKVGIGGHQHAGSTNGGSEIYVKWGGVYPPLIMKALSGI